MMDAANRMGRIWRVLLLTSLVVILGGCGAPSSNTMTSAPITEAEVQAAQEAWGAGIVRIGEIYLEGGDSRAAAQEHLETFYNYGQGMVLFKPTLASEVPFRPTFAGALSYFVAGDEAFPEDHGFAIRPWQSVRWENLGTHIRGDMAVAMGHYFFSPADGGDEVKVEYSFAYVRDADGGLRIILHGSHLPYAPDSPHTPVGQD